MRIPVFACVLSVSSEMRIPVFARVFYQSAMEWESLYLCVCFISQQWNENPCICVCVLWISSAMRSLHVDQQRAVPHHRPSTAQDAARGGCCCRSESHSRCWFSGPSPLRSHTCWWWSSVLQCVHAGLLTFIFINSCDYSHYYEHYDSELCECYKFQVQKQPMWCLKNCQTNPAKEIRDRWHARLCVTCSCSRVSRQVKWKCFCYLLLFQSQRQVKWKSFCYLFLFKSQETGETEVFLLPVLVQQSKDMQTTRLSVTCSCSFPHRSGHRPPSLSHPAARGTHLSPLKPKQMSVESSTEDVTTVWTVWTLKALPKWSLRKKSLP